MPARSIGTATISFGLVAIPVKVFTSSEPSHEIHFHMIHEDCGERLKQQYVCPKHGHVERDEITKGFEIRRGNFVELSKEELEKLEAVASNEVEIREFVPASAVDPIFVDRTYYLGPGKGGERAYRLLRDALEKAELVGIAAYAARGKQYVVMVRAFETGLAMHQLRYGDEIKPWTEVPVEKLPKPPASELALAAKVIEHLRHDSFDPSKYEDEVKGRVRDLIAEKAKGGEIVVAPEAPRPAVTDLMAALKASLEGTPVKEMPERGRATNGHRRPTRKSHAPRAHPARGRRHTTRARAA